MTLSPQDVQVVDGLITALTERRISIPKIFIHLTGDLDQAAVLSEIHYWSLRSPDGWFYRPYSSDKGISWFTETGLSQYKVSKAIESLNGSCAELIETDLRKPRLSRGGMALAPVLHYRIDPDRLRNWIIKFFNSRPDYQNPLYSDIKIFNNPELIDTVNSFSVSNDTDSDADGAAAPQPDQPQLALNDETLYPTEPHETIVFSEINTLRKTQGRSGWKGYDNLIQRDELRRVFADIVSREGEPGLRRACRAAISRGRTSRAAYFNYLRRWAKNLTTGKGNQSYRSKQNDKNSAGSVQTERIENPPTGAHPAIKGLWHNIPADVRRYIADNPGKLKRQAEMLSQADVIKVSPDEWLTEIRGNEKR